MYRGLRVALLVAGTGLTGCKSRPSPPGDAAPTVAISSAIIDASAPPAHPPESVPLSFDIDSKKRDAMAFGPSTRIRVLEDAFIVAGVGPGGYFDRAVDFVQRTLTAFYNGRFEKRPPYAVLLLFFSRWDDFAAYLDEHFHLPAKKYYGAYGTYTHVAAVDGSGGLPYLPTISHELAHAIIESADFPERPAWWGECVASLYEAPTFPAPGEIRGEPGWRDREVLRPALHPKDGGAAPDIQMNLLFDMDDDTFKATLPDGGTDARMLAIHEATARSVCEWLDGQGKLWPLYRAWKEHFAEDPKGIASFTSVMGATPRQANDAWRNFAKRL